MVLEKNKETRKNHCLSPPQQAHKKGFSFNDGNCKFLLLSSFCQSFLNIWGLLLRSHSPHGWQSNLRQMYFSLLIPQWLFTALRTKFIFQFESPVFRSTFIFSRDSINVLPVIVTCQQLIQVSISLHMLLPFLTLLPSSRLPQVLPWPSFVPASFLYVPIMPCTEHDHGLCYHIIFITHLT